MINIVLKGLFIGFLSSAPMGPVGMLCIQRTLNEGRKSGIMTGLGAVMGDMLIASAAILAALGLGFSAAFIEKHEDILKIIGSLVLIIFGYIVFKKNPSKNLKKLTDDSSSNWKIFISSFILTISNIATLFLYIALFARFNVIDNAFFSYNFITIFCIGVGASLWWLLITYIVNKLRKRFNLRGLMIFNRIVGSLLIFLGIVGIISVALAKLHVI